MCGFLFFVIFGGMTGIALACMSLDVPWHDTYFVVAHFHFIMVAVTLMAFLAGLHYWFPKLFGKAIPEGEIEIYVEDPAIQDSTQRRVAETHVNSDGASKTIAFSLAQPADAEKMQIVARLTRADGWLIARGSVQVALNAPVTITLKQVIY